MMAKRRLKNYEWFELSILLFKLDFCESWKSPLGIFANKKVISALPRKGSRVRFQETSKYI